MGVCVDALPLINARHGHCIYSSYLGDYTPCLQRDQPIGAAVGVAHDGQVDWGHLKADVVQVGRRLVHVGRAVSALPV